MQPFRIDIWQVRDRIQCTCTSIRFQGQGSKYRSLS